MNIVIKQVWILLIPVTLLENIVPLLISAILEKSLSINLCPKAPYILLSGS